MSVVALVTDADSLPIDYDMPLLLDACRTIGLEVEVQDWKDADVDWPAFEAVLLRSPWTYVDRLSVFLDWCADVAASTQLLNPLPVVRWSLDKHYMADLAAHGVPVVPSTFVEPGAEPLATVRAFLAAHPRSEEIVVKPTVGAYSKDVQRFRREREAEAARHVEYLLRDGEVLLQPYLESVDLHGETDMIYFDGVYSHAIRKEALLMPDGTVNVPTFECRTPRDADEDERAVASAVLDATASHLGLDQSLLYGRIDLIRDDGGKPIVLEMELCEPSLNLPFTDGGAMRFAEALERRVKA